MTRARTDGKTTALILGGDPVVGRALASLLESAGRGARYVDADYLERSGAFDDVGVLLLAPPWSSGELEAVLRVISEAPAASGTPVLTIGAPEDDADVSPENSVPWPCRMEELQQRVDAALRAGRRTN